MWGKSYMNLLHLRYFQSVAEESSITRAAEKLNISEPSLSITISRLEKEIGVPLFERVGRNIRLSKHGRIFYDHVSKGLYSIDTGVAAIRNNYQRGQNTFTVHTTAMALVSNFVLDYIAKNPKYYLNVRPIAVSEINASYHNPRVDFVLSSVPFHAEDCSQVSIHEEQLYIVLNKEHPLAKEQKANLSDLKDEFFIFPPPKKSGILENIYEMFRRENIMPNVVSECDLPLRLSMVSMNKGITVAAESALIKERIPENVCFLPIDSENATRTLSIMWNSSRYLYPIEEQFIREFQEYCKEQYTPHGAPFSARSPRK